MLARPHPLQAALTSLQRDQANKQLSRPSASSPTAPPTKEKSSREAIPVNTGDVAWSLVRPSSTHSSTHTGRVEIFSSVKPEIHSAGHCQGSHQVSSTKGGSNPGWKALPLTCRTSPATLPETTPRYHIQHERPFNYWMQFDVTPWTATNEFKFKRRVSSWVPIRVDWRVLSLVVSTPALRACLAGTAQAGVLHHKTGRTGQSEDRRNVKRAQPWHVCETSAIAPRLFEGISTGSVRLSLVQPSSLLCLTHSSKIRLLCAWNPYVLECTCARALVITMTSVAGAPGCNRSRTPRAS
jgi:hypothetical protein